MIAPSASSAASAGLADSGSRPKRRSERGLRDGSEPFQPAAQDFGQRRLARPGFCRLVRRRRDLGLEPRIRPQRAELVQPLGGNP